MNCRNNPFKKGTAFITEEEIKAVICSVVEQLEPCTSDEELIETLMKLSDNSSRSNTD